MGFFNLRKAQFVNPETFLLGANDGVTFIYKDGKMYYGPRKQTHEMLAEQNEFQYTDQDICGRTAMGKVAFWNSTKIDPYDARFSGALNKLYNDGKITLESEIWIYPSIKGMTFSSYMKQLNNVEQTQDKEPAFSAYGQRGIMNLEKTASFLPSDAKTELLASINGILEKFAAGLSTQPKAPSPTPAMPTGNPKLRVQPAVPIPNSLPPGSDVAVHNVRVQIETLLKQFFARPDIKRLVPHAGVVNEFLGVVDNEIKQILFNRNYTKGLDEQLSRVPKADKNMTTTPENVTEEILASRNQKILGVLTAMVGLADLADQNGLRVEADKIDAVLPKVSLLKLAQYESALPYWIMNDRAFQLALREKRKKKEADGLRPDDQDQYNSWQECWWETLDEYQKSLEGNHAEFLGKYAQNASADSFLTYLPLAKALSDRISMKLEAGSHPGVAYFEALDEMANGPFAMDTIADIYATLDSVLATAEKEKNEKVITAAKEAKEKLAGIADFLGDLGGKALSPFNWGLGKLDQGFSDFSAGLTRGMHGKIPGLAQQIYEDYAPAIEREIENIKNNPQPTPSKLLHKNLSKYFPTIDAFLKMAKGAGYPVPEAGSLQAKILANKTVGQQEIAAIEQMWDTIWRYASPQNAKQMQANYNAKSKQMQQQRSKPTPQAPLNWRQNPDIAKAVADALQANMGKIQNPNVRKKVRDLIDMVAVAFTSWGREVKAAPVVDWTRQRRNPYKKAPAAPATQAPAAKPQITPQQIETWLRGNLGSAHDDFIQSVMSSFNQAQQAKAPEAAAPAASPAAPAAAPSAPAAPGMIPDNIELEKAPAAAPGAIPDNIELEKPEGTPAAAPAAPAAAPAGTGIKVQPAAPAATPPVAAPAAPAAVAPAAAPVAAPAAAQVPPIAPIKNQPLPAAPPGAAPVKPPAAPVAPGGVRRPTLPVGGGAIKGRPRL